MHIITNIQLDMFPSVVAIKGKAKVPIGNEALTKEFILVRKLANIFSSTTVTVREYTLVSNFPNKR